MPIAAFLGGAIATFSGPPSAGGQSVLEDPGFEQWDTATMLTAWEVQPGPGATVYQEVAGARSGTALGLTSPGSATTRVLSWATEAGSGDVLSGSVYVNGPGTARVSYVLLDTGSIEVARPVGEAVLTEGGFTFVSFQHTVTRAETVYARLRIEVSGPGPFVVDDAAFEVVAAADTPTPEPTDTPGPTATETQIPATATSPGGGGSAPDTTTPTRTPTPTRTSTPTKTPTGTRAATAAATSTPAKAPSSPPGKPTAPLPTSTPTLRAGSSSGGLLANGDFEVSADGKPAYWQKLGGEMFTGQGNAGLAGCLESGTTSTKWLYQVVPVSGGGWFEGSAIARIEGAGTASIRLSWYESADGSGSQVSAPEGTTTTLGGWANIAVGPIQAPESANSVRFRLVLQPEGNVTACFDDAVFFVSEPPPAEAEPSPATPQPIAATQTNTPARTATPRSAGTAGRAPTGATPVTQPSSTAGGPRALRISEIMSDPAAPGRDAAFEWVELVNFGTDPIDVAGWRLGDGTRETVLPAAVVPPGAYVVVAGAEASLPATAIRVAPSGGEIGNGLGNDGDVVRLLAPEATIIDELSYGENDDVFDPAPEAPGPGETIGLSDPAADPASENWSVTLRPTPGEPNVFPPRPVSTVAGEGTAAPDAQEDAETKPEFLIEPPGSDGASPVPWIVFGGLVGVSAGVVGLSLGPRLKSRWERFRAR